ncbi:MAG: putative DNA binding domain-containing protein [Chloroflexota bacterium]|nr:putative DNA binding domain-containing protein [Chloroflexota bacterium]
MKWYGGDLHIHTPGSKDYQQPEITYLDILKQAESKGLRIVAFTDHNTVAGYAEMQREIADLERWRETGRITPEEEQQLEEYQRLLDKMLVLPGFELTATFGFHILGIFDKDTPVRALEHVLIDLNVPIDLIGEGETEVGSTSDVITAYRTMAEAGALVIAAHADSNHGVAMMRLNFGGQTRISYTQNENLHALEVTDLEKRGRHTTKAFFDGSKPQYPRRMHCIQGSDAHRLTRKGNHLGVGDRATDFLLPELSFDALKELFLTDDFSRTRPYKRHAPARPGKVERARKAGQTEQRSFHEHMKREGGCLYAIVRDVAAFANTKGGHIYVGVKADPKAPPKGVGDPDQAMGRLGSEIKRLISPPLDVNMTALETEGKHVIRIDIPQGDERPYVLEGSKIYVRQGARSELAMRDQIITLVGEVLREGGPPLVKERRPEREPKQGEREAPSEREREREIEAPEGAVQPPRSGVEIVKSEKRNGELYHTMRDLRNGNEVDDVTRSSARRLWRYAIALKEKGIFNEDKVSWDGSLGLWHKYKRAGRDHYDLVQKMPDGGVRVYYGVNEDGLEGPWEDVVEKK